MESDPRAGTLDDRCPLTPEAVAGAEAVAGVAWTDAERALMLERLAAQRQLSALRRAALPDVAPASRFDPRLPDWRAPPPQDFRPPEIARRPLPDTEADIAFAPLAVLAEWMRHGELSSERLTAIYLDRIARHDITLGSFANVAGEPAMRQARRADALATRGDWRGPLHGIPYGCKDIIDTAGIATEWGAEPYRCRVPAANAVVVDVLERAGAVLLGKTSVGALASGDAWLGRQTRNPWNPDQGSSGSSAGSASAVAAGLCAFALGTETLGSIICPSLRCGTTGLRPTFGRISRAGVMPLAWSLDKIGAMARSVADTALVMSVLTEAAAGDPSHIAAPFGWDAGRGLDGLRLGYFPADLHEPDAHKLDRDAIDGARGLGLELVPLSRPERPYAALEHILHAEAAAAFEDLTLSGGDDMLCGQGPRDWPNAFRAARFLSAVDHVQLDRLRRQVMGDMDAAFAQVDAIIGPALAGPMLIISNFTGHPCLVLRSGFRAPDAPHAVCLWGRLFDEGTLLSLGLGLERRFDLWHVRPVGFE